MGPHTQKKTWGYKERDPLKRKAYLRLRERYIRRQKTFVYVDESGFERPSSGNMAEHREARKCMGYAQEIPARVRVC